MLQRTAKGESTVIASTPVENFKGKIELRVSAVNDEYRFAYSLDSGNTYTELGDPQSGDILSTDIAGGFVGNLLGLYSTSDNTAIPQ